MADITFRWLEGDDLLQLEPVLASRGWASLNGRTCRALAAFDSDRLVGFYVFQLFPHVEPLYVEPDYYGTGVADELANRMQKFLADVQARGYMLIADNPVVERMARERGMTRVDSPVYVYVNDVPAGEA